MTNPIHPSLGHPSITETGRRALLRRRGSSTWVGGLALVAAALPTAGWAAPCRAGVALVSRQSFIRATGGPGPNGFDLSDGTTNFGRFANDLSNAPSDDPSSGSVPVLSEAHQYSVPGITEQDFQGAYAEGSVRAGVHTPHSNAAAESNFDLTFRVTGGSADFTFGAAMGTAGTGTVMAELMNVTPTVKPSAVSGKRTATADTSGAPIFSSTLTPTTDHSNTIDQQGVLRAGVYTLRVHAGSDDAAVSPDDSSAYYSMSLTLAPSSSTPATAVPLPAAAWTGLSVLCGVASAQVARRKKRAA
jgi:hypothetical protein